MKYYYTFGKICARNEVSFIPRMVDGISATESMGKQVSVELADYNDKYCTLKSVRPLAERYLQTANSGQRSEGYAALSLIALRFAQQPPLVHGGRHAHKPITASHEFPGHAHPYANRPSYREPGSAPPNRRGPQRNVRNAGRLFCRRYGDFKVSHYEQDNVAGGLEREVPQRVFKLRSVL